MPAVSCVPFLFCCQLLQHTQLLQLNVTPAINNVKTFVRLQRFPLPSSKEISEFCFVDSGNNVIWALQMIYVPFSSRTLENYLEDMNTKHFFIFSSDFNCYDICPRETVRRGEGGRGKPFIVYWDPYGKNIHFPHIWFNTACTFVRHMWMNANRGEFLWNQTDYMAKNISVEARFIYSIVNWLLRRAGTVLAIKMSGETSSWVWQKPPGTAQAPVVASSCFTTNPVLNNICIGLPGVTSEKGRKNVAG